MLHYRRFCQKAGKPLSIRFIDKCLQVLNDEAMLDKNFCGAGKNYVAVLSTGDVYLCHRAASSKTFKLGNIFNKENQIVRGTFLTIDKESMGCIENCRASKSCHTCILTNYIVNKDFMKPLKENHYCDICLAEHDFCESYLPIELTDRNERLLKSIGKVVADLAEKINEK
jgi:radical SAM protein with 4Fe4S-binding SPASM domain